MALTLEHYVLKGPSACRHSKQTPRLLLACSLPLWLAEGSLSLGELLGGPSWSQTGTSSLGAPGHPTTPKSLGSMFTFSFGCQQ